MITAKDAYSKSLKMIGSYTDKIYKELDLLNEMIENAIDEGKFSIEISLMNKDEDMYINELTPILKNYGYQIHYYYLNNSKQTHVYNISWENDYGILQ